MDVKIKTEFVKQCLIEIGKDINEAQERAIRKHLHYRSGRLLNERIFNYEDGNFMDGKLILTHPVYERFLDIKKKPRVSSNVETWRKRRKKPKSYPIHNRIIMGNYNRLASNLMYGLTEEVASKIKQELDNQTI